MKGWRSAVFAAAACWVLPAVVSAASLAAPAPIAAQAAAPTADGFARTIDAHYDHLHSLLVHFVQAYDGMGMHRVDSGTLLLTKGGRFHAGSMRWTYTQPAGKLFVFDGKNAYFYTPGQAEVQRTPASQLDDLRSPLALLLGHAHLAKQLDNLAVTPAADGQRTLTGVPHGMEQRVQQVSITADASGAISRMVIEDVDGSRNSFQFAAEQPNVPAPDSAFAFTPPPGTHVVDGMAPM